MSANVRGRDIGSFVAEAQNRIKQEFTLPPGRYSFEFGGQFEHLQQARTRLLIVVPVALLLIFGLLYVTYQNWIDVLRVFTAVPFGWVGGIFALWLRDMPFSISAAIGFIALSGVAVLDAMILVSYIRQLRAKGMSLERAVEDAATTRLRPVLMTTLVASLGFLPMAFSTGMGAEVQRPLGHRRHRRRDQRHDHVAAWCCACCIYCSIRRLNRQTKKTTPKVPKNWQASVQFDFFRKENAMNLGKLVVIVIGIASLAVLSACSKSPDQNAPAAAPTAQVSTEGHSHEGWWCDEHGVPESVCAQCNNKLAADFKAKGDWCAKHDRPDSQCFVCHPENEAKFVALYEAKYGKKPPERKE